MFYLIHYYIKLSKYKYKQFLNKYIMENKKEENDKKYILGSMNNIDGFIKNNDYRRAFVLLIMVLERLDDKQKNEFIDYYSKNIEGMGIFNSR